ncbi:MAG: endolytic transglycosylase MltG [bacterium]|nr:endolytic transglycosylase MltG [bacterium]
MKRALVVAGLACLLLAAGLGWSWSQWTQRWPTGPRYVTQRVRVPSGMSAAALADTLCARGLLRHRLVLLAGARLTGQGRRLQAGLFEVPPGLPVRDLLALFTRPGLPPVRVTIPEGLDAPQTARLLAAAFGCDPTEFLDAANRLTAQLRGQRGGPAGAVASARLDSVLVSEAARAGRVFHRCEGYLAPDTYFFAEDTPAITAAARLVEAQFARLDSLLAGPRSPAAAGLSAHELLTLASIIEAETSRPDERARVGAVYLNRLRLGMNLAADPTVAFATQKKGQRLLYRDLEVESDWNTYRRSGLPPGPIGSPGMASLRAAARPDPACRAVFFVADGQGGHVFSNTAQEHEEAVRRYRARRDAALAGAGARGGNR